MAGGFYPLTTTEFLEYFPILSLVKKQAELRQRFISFGSCATLISKMNLVCHQSFKFSFSLTFLLVNSSIILSANRLSPSTKNASQEKLVVNVVRRKLLSCAWE